MQRTEAVRLAVPDARPAPRRTASAGVVLRAVLDHGPIARSAIGRLTGLSAASVTGHSADLLACGLLREHRAGVTPNGRGRPHLPVDLDTTQHMVCGLHVAVDYVTAALLDTRGRALASRTVPHEAGDAATAILDRAADHLEALMRAYGAGRIPLGVGVATGGWVDSGAGTVVEHALLGWRDVEVGRRLSSRLGLPVHVDSHSRSLVRAEQLFGHVRSRDSVLMLFVGNVVDAAFATGDHLHHGPRSKAARVAHLPVAGSREPCPCGRIGCLQATVGEGAVARAAVRRGLGRGSFEELLAAAEAGDTGARRLLRDRAAWLGQAVALLAELFNPDLLVVVERGIDRFDDCLRTLREEVRLHSTADTDPETVVVPTSFPDTALAVAGGAVLLDLLYRDPLGHARPHRRAS